jgi:hypothetical protein
LYPTAKTRNGRATTDDIQQSNASAKRLREFPQKADCRLSDTAVTSNTTYFEP